MNPNLNDVLDRFGPAATDGDRNERDERLRVSTEGFGELITRIKNAATGRDKHGTKPSDKKPGEKLAQHDKSWTDEAHAAIAELKRMLDKYYLNDNWLNGQKFYEGNIQADDFSGALVLDNKIGRDPLKNPGIAADRIKQFTTAWLPQVKKLEAAVSAINDRVEKATKGAAEDDANAVALVKKAIAEMNALPDPLKNVPKLHGTSLGNRVLVVKAVQGRGQWLRTEVKTPPVPVSSLPALTKEQIKQAAQLIKEIYTPEGKFDFGAYVGGWLDHSNGSDFNEWIYEADNHVYMNYYDRFEYQGAAQTYLEAVDTLFNTHAVVRALEKWINRSIH